MPGEVINLGPFTGGVTTRVSDPSALAEEDLQEANNVLYDIYGNLVTRPPIEKFSNQPPPGTGEQEVVISGFLSAQDEDEVRPFIIVSNDSGTYVRDSYPVANGNWLQISTAKYSVAVQGSRGTESVVWFAKGEDSNGDSVNGGYWGLGDTSITTYSNIPEAEAAVWYKERVFFLNTGVKNDASRVQYSNITPDANTDFPSGNEFYVNTNDGQSIRDAVVYLDNIFVFKYNSTYIATYDTAIDRLQIKAISDTVGAQRRRVIQIYGDTLFVYHNRFIWRFTGSQFVPLSQKIIVQSEAFVNVGSDFTLSQWADTLILRMDDTAYVYNFYTEAWTTWTSTRMFNYIVKYSLNDYYSQFAYYGGQREGTDLIRLRTTWPLVRDPEATLTEDSSEQFKATLVTKQYDFEQPQIWKRLFWWGLNGVFDSREANPILRAGFYPVDEYVGVPPVWNNLEVADAKVTLAHAQMFKFVRSHRFRLAAFYIEIDCDGGTPNTINTLTVVVKTAQVIRGNNTSAQVSTSLGRG